MQRLNETVSIAAKPSGGSISPLEAHAAVLLGLIAEQADLTLDEIVAVMRKRRIAGSRSAVWRFFKRHNVSFKKSLRAAEQQRADVVRARRRWMREQGMFDPARPVFIDETSTNTAMVRLRGRCPRGFRLTDHVPHGHWKTITFIAGLRRRAMVAPFVLDGPMNSTSFMAYLKRCLVPTLKRGDIVMMDSLPVHKAAGVREVIEAAGETALPPQVFAGPQSDRDGVQQTQSASTKSSRANHSASLTQDRRSRGRVQSASVRQLLPTCRLRFHVTGIRSNLSKDALASSSPTHGRAAIAASQDRGAIAQHHQPTRIPGDALDVS